MDNVSMGGLEDYARKVTRSLSREIESGSRSFAVKRLKSFSENMDDLAKSLSETAGKFRERRSDSLADLLEVFSEGLASLSGNLKDDYIQDIISEVEDFARRRPVISIGAALAAGVLIWRLSSSSRPGARRSDGGRAPYVEDITGRKEEKSYGPH